MPVLKPLKWVDAVQPHDSQAQSREKKVAAIGNGYVTVAQLEKTYLATLIGVYPQPITERFHPTLPFNQALGRAALWAREHIAEAERADS